MVDAQAHAARTMWNLLHAWWRMMPKEKRTLANADAAIRQARRDIDFLAVLPAQAAQAVLKTYFQAWRNCWDGRADAPNFKGRFRSVMSVDIPQGRDLNITRVHRRWGMVNIPKVGRVRFRWTRDLPVGKRAGAENRITGARLIKDALGCYGGILHKVPAPGTSQRCPACGFTTPGNRESQAVFACKNPDCGWSGNADLNAARNILHLYRMGLALTPAAGRAVVRRARRAKPAAARQAGISRP
ncbi:transposase [Streptomyces sp. NBC_01589]|uniref:zinc ribbon domain-containing protein n=1 Tax=Streptomyces sp. NBC_01589 TaxID=2975886 RepID=UPI003870B9AA